MKKIITVIALGFFTQAFAEQSHSIVLSCMLSGKDEIISNKFPKRVEEINKTNVLFFVDKNSRGNWTFQEGSQPLVSTKKELEDVKNNEKEFYYYSIVEVNKHSIYDEVKSRLPSYIDKNSEEIPTIIFNKSTLINRISGEISYQVTIDSQYPSGLTSKSFRKLTGECKSVANLF